MFSQYQRPLRPAAARRQQWRGRELTLLTICRGEHTFEDLPRLAPTDTERLCAFLNLYRALQQVHARRRA